MVDFFESINYLIDTHKQPCLGTISINVITFGSIPTMIECDDNYPDFADLLAELDHAKLIYFARLLREHYDEH